MNKLLKNVLNIVLITVFAFLLKNKVPMYNIMGIVGIYFSVYFFVKLNSEKFDNFEGEEIITILISYMLQKAQVLLHKEVYKNKLYLTVNIIMMMVFIIFFLYKYRKMKKISLKNIWDSTYNFLVISMPFFLIIGSKFPIVISVIYLIQSIRKKEFIWDKDIKKIYISILCLILFSLTSFIGNDIDSSQIKMFRRFSENLILLMLFIQMKFSDEEIKKIISVGISSAIIPIVPVMVQFLQMKNLYYRYGEDNANIWGFEAVFWTVILLHLILFKKKKEYIFLYLLYVIGALLSGSRGAILDMVIVNIIIFIYKYRKQTKMLFSIFIITILIGFGILKTNNRVSYTYNLIKNEKKVDSSSYIRLTIYKEAWEQFKLKPINGFGVNGYRKTSIKRNLENNTRKLSYIEENAYSQAHAHNNILNFLCTTGILGTLSYISMLYFICRKVLKNMSNGGFLVLSLMFVYELYGIFEISIYHGSRQRFLFFIIGLYIARSLLKTRFSKKEK